jgi:uncharacterized small protein (DUF1192 family)
VAQPHHVLVAEVGAEQRSGQRVRRDAAHLLELRQVHEDVERVGLLDHEIRRAAHLGRVLDAHERLRVLLVLAAPPEDLALDAALAAGAIGRLEVDRLHAGDLREVPAQAADDVVARGICAGTAGREREREAD